MKFTKLMTGAALTLMLGACAQTWQTHYDEAPAAGVSTNWRASAIAVAVPDSLTVSEANVYAPAADIVWRGEVRGDRHKQVQRIIHEATVKGTSKLKRGSRPVRVEVTVGQFHALSHRARYQLQQSGVHNIKLAIRVIDTRTGAVLASENDIQADLLAYTGEDALQAEAAGQTQRVRIVNHVSKVIAGWLGTGPDARSSFTRIGR